MNKKFLLSAIAGIGSLILLFSNFGFSISADSFISTEYFFVLDIVSILLYVLYVYGFVALGEKHSVQPMMYGAYAWIALSLAGAVYSYLVPDPAQESVIGLIISLVIMASIIVVGLHMLKLKSHYGEYATGYGILAMLSATGIPYLVGGAFGGIAIDALAYVVAILIFFRAAKR